MKERLHNIYIWLDYTLILPLLSILPIKFGRFFASLRGVCYYYLKRDWRSFTFNDTQLHERVLMSYKEIFPEISLKELSQLVKKRYISQSLEEYEAMLVIKNRFHKIAVEYHNIEPLLDFFKTKKNNIFITSHFGSSIEGFIHLNIFKTPVMVMTSNVTKHPQVHKSISKFYDQKYRHIDPFLNGGKMVDVEGNMKKFFRFLKNDGSLAIVADLPPGNPDDNATIKNFFGKNRAFAAGAEKLSTIDNSKIIPYVCYYENNTYHMVFGSLEEDPYHFLEKEIKKRPHLWWASDLLSCYPIKEKVE